MSQLKLELTEQDHQRMQDLMNSSVIGVPAERLKNAMLVSKQDQTIVMSDSGDE